MQVYRFGKYEFEPQMGRLDQADGDTCTIRPKTAELMTFLIKNNSRIVSKQEILATVWEGAAVHDQVVFQSINEIRKILGKGPYIKTFPKKGYQWIIPVTSHEVDCETAEAKEPEPIAAHIEIPPQPTPTDPAHQTMPSLAQRLPLILASCAALVLTVGYLFQLQSPPAATATPPADESVDYTALNGSDKYQSKLRLAVLPFENSTGDQEKEWVSMGLMDMVNQSLDAAAYLDLISTSEVLATYSGLVEHIADPTDPLIHNRQPNVRKELHSAFNADYLLSADVSFQDETYFLDYLITHRNGEKQADRIAFERISQLAVQLGETTAKFIRPNETHSFSCKFPDNGIANKIYARGIQSFYAGDMEMAIDHFRVALENEPEFLFARVMLLESYQAAGDFDKVTAMGDETLQAALAQDNQTAQIRSLFALSGLAIHQQEYAKADAHLQKALEIGRHMDHAFFEARAYHLLAESAQGAGDVSKSERHYLEALAQFGRTQCAASQTNTLIALGNLNADHNRPQKSERYYRQALTMARDAEEALDAARIQLALGKLLVRQNRVDQARTQLDAAVNTFAIFRSRPEIMAAKAALGEILFSQSQPQAALALFEADLAEKDPFAYRAYGLLLSQQGRDQSAFEHLSQAVMLFQAHDHGREAAITAYTLADLYAGKELWQDAARQLVFPDQWFSHHGDPMTKQVSRLKARVAAQTM